MKKTATLFILFLLIGMMSAAFSQKTPALKNGLSIKAQIGFPSASFGTTEDVEDDYKYGISYGLQVGSQWYFYKPESVGIGLMVNWIDATFTSKTVTTSMGELERATLDLGLLEFGPVFTYAIDDPMAIDLYYNFRPTILSNTYQFGTEDREGYGGFGVTHAFGLGFRFNILYVGGEYVTGNAKVSQDTTDEDIWMDEKVKADCFRILVGVKF
jgi:hypothetical protein